MQKNILLILCKPLLLERTECQHADFKNIKSQITGIFKALQISIGRMIVQAINVVNEFLSRYS